jgi:hypothetical protein
VTDQNIPWHVRAVPFDDAMNPNVRQSNQRLVIVDGSVPKAQVVTASVPGGQESAANGFMLYPDYTDVTLTAELVANIDGDLDNDGVIEPDAGEDVNLGLDSLLFQYSLKRPDPALAAILTSNGIDDDNDGVIDNAIEANMAAVLWHDIPFSQYSTPMRAPNADGKWRVTWQFDFSHLINESHDQYIPIRVVGTDTVGNEDIEDPILTIMVLDDNTGPMAHIRFVDGSNVLDPHLAVTKRTHGEGDAGKVDVEIEARRVAALTLEYRKEGDTSWTTVETVTDVVDGVTIEWLVASLAEGKYELRATAFNGDGSSAIDDDGNPVVDIVWVIVDHTEPEVVGVRVWVDEDRADGYEGDE